MESPNGSKRPVLHAVISGYYGYNNLGDDAILLSICQRLSAAGIALKLTVLSHDPEETRKIYGVEAVHRFQLPKVLRALKDCDLLISGGGSLLQDRTSTRSLLYYLSVIHMARRYGKPVMVYANGIGPISRQGNREKTARTLSQVDRITLRDADSLRELQAMGVTVPVTVAADPVFLLRGVETDQAKELLDEAGAPRDQKLLGISLRGVAGTCLTEASLAAFCDRLSEAYDCFPVFLVMQTPADELVSRRVQRLMHRPSCLFASGYAPDAMMGVIGQMEAVVSMRLHTVVFAAAQRVPVVGYEYDPKVTALLQQLHMPTCGTLTSFDETAAAQVVGQVLSDRAQYRAALDGTVKDLEEKARINEQVLLDLVEERNLLRR